MDKIIYTGHVMDHDDSFFDKSGEENIYNCMFKD